MKILSIENPLAYFIVFGIKDIENFDWTTDYRGDVLIHTTGTSQEKLNYDPIPEKLWLDYEKYCSKFEGDDAKNEVAWDNFYDGNCESINERILALTSFCDIYSENKKMFLEGQAAIGVIELVDVIQNSDSPYAEKGMYHWVFRNPRVLLPPICNIKGDMNLENIDDEITKKIKHFSIDQDYINLDDDISVLVSIKDIPLKILDTELSFTDNE